MILYLNTDLEIVSADDPTKLANELELKGVFSLQIAQREDGLWQVTLETETQHDNPESNLIAMLERIEALNGTESLSLWKNSDRVFDIGYRCGNRPWGFHQEISAQALRRVAAAGASLRVTLYPSEIEGGTV